MIEVFNDHGARAEYYPDFFGNLGFEDLLPGGRADINWKQQVITIFGKTNLEPRLSAWYGLPYRYASTHWPAQAFPPILTEMNDELIRHTGFSFNSVLLNCYRSGHDYMGWHRDNEKEIDQQLIASVSFGATRDFIFRAKAQKEKKSTIALESGSLLLMYNCQDRYEHCLPKRKKIHDQRLNLTFRRITA